MFQNKFPFFLYFVIIFVSTSNVVAQESDKNDTSVFLKFPVNPEVVKQIEDIISAKGMGPSNPEVVKQLEAMISAKGMGEPSHQPKSSSKHEQEPPEPSNHNYRQEPDNSRQETEPSNQSKGPSYSPSQEPTSLLPEPTDKISSLTESTATTAPLPESTAKIAPFATVNSPSIIQTPIPSPMAKTSALPPPIAKTPASPPSIAKTPSTPSPPIPKSPMHTTSNLPATSTSKVSFAEHITIDNFFFVTFTTFLCYFVGNFVILF
ncbi:hypothetical protein C2G38_1088888 [Gigaspora rosea]|uniref:Uncharacterized protein n=1 Tax=Gigaspora rosea TaxID=44941 RepID=A0A397VGC9_9GLOM|nr:hypothetical protein C2G38_1088888 [Gigaspora rosea]